MTEPEYSQPTTCFACGTENPHGLHVTFRRSEDGGATGMFTPSTNHEGWPGIVHGGILATLLDEAMAYALWFSSHRAVTVRMEVRFREAIAAGDEVNIIARVVGTKRNLIDAVGSVCRRDGRVVATASGRFMAADVSY